MKLQELEPRHLRALYTKLKAHGLSARTQDSGLSARTILHVHRVIRKALADGLGEYVSVNVADAKAARPSQPAAASISALDPAGVHRLLDAAEGSPYRSLFALALYTGMRRSELLGLTWAAVDIEGGALSVTQGLHRLTGNGLVAATPKTSKSRRRIALSPDASAILKAQHVHQAEQRLRAGPLWQVTDYVFTRADGRPIDPDAATHAFRRIADAAGFQGLRLHDTRHTHATLMLAAGVHPKIVSERLGHATVQITLDTYSHVLPGLQEAAAMAFDAGLRSARAVAEPTGV